MVIFLPIKSIKKVILHANQIRDLMPMGEGKGLLTLRFQAAGELASKHLIIFVCLLLSVFQIWHSCQLYFSAHKYKKSIFMKKKLLDG